MRCVLDVEQPRAAVVDGQHVNAETALERSVPVEIVDDDLQSRVALQLDDDARRFVALVTDRTDLRENLFRHQLGDPLDEHGTVFAIGNLVIMI
jgi:hypothetical protein